MDHMALTHLHHVPEYIKMAAIQLASHVLSVMSLSVKVRGYFFPLGNYIWHHNKHRLFGPKQTLEADRHSTYRYWGHRKTIK